MASVEYFEELAYLNCRSVSLRGAVKRMAVAVVHETVPEARLTSAAWRSAPPDDGPPVTGRNGRKVSRRGKPRNPENDNRRNTNMSINEMEVKARELRQLQALIEEAQAEAEAIKDAIKAAMGDSESVQAGEYRITWKAVTSSRIDTSALRKALPDVAERFTKETVTRRFVIS